MIEQLNNHRRLLICILLAAVTFADYLPAGEHKYSYLIQATTPGTFAAPPAYAEQMYEPEVYGRNSSGVTEIGK